MIYHLLELFLRNQEYKLEIEAAKILPKKRIFFMKGTLIRMIKIFVMSKIH